MAQASRQLIKQKERIDYRYVDRTVAEARLKFSERLPFLLNRVGAALATSFEAEALEARGLTLPIYRILSALSDNGPLRQVDVVDLVSIEPWTVSRLIGRMVSRGLVIRSRSPNSDREVLLKLTPKGSETIKPLREIGLKFDVLATQGLSATDIKTLKVYLRHIYANIALAREKKQIGAPRRRRPEAHSDDVKR